VIETRMGSHVEEIMSAARKAAAQLQAEVERASTERAAQIETAAARRAHAVRLAAEADRVHAQTRAAAQQYMAASRRLVDEFSKERMQRIADIGDRLAAQAEALVERLMRSDEVARQLNELRAALGAACELIAVEAGRDSPNLPELPRPPAIAGEATAVDPPHDPPEDTDVAAPRTLEQRLARATGRRARRPAPANEPLADPGPQEPADVA
jgi:DNA repair exonuclease SbcCD ATPase subunit